MFSANKIFNLLLVCLLFLLLFNVDVKSASLDSTNVKKDSIKGKVIKPKAVIHSPRKAGIMSTILPGLGQCYNKKYWKAPIIYAGLGTFGYFFTTNLKQYKIGAAEIRWRNDTAVEKSEWHGDVYDVSYSATDILATASQYRRYAELSAIGFLVFYTFQIVDAVVDAHLFTFDVSDELSMKIEPTILPYNKTVGVSFTLGIK